MAKYISKASKKAALGTQKGANLGLKCVRLRLAAGLHDSKQKSARMATATPAILPAERLPASVFRCGR